MRLPSLPASAWRGHWHWVLWLLITCLAAQGLAIGAQRAAGHFHRLPVAAEAGRDAAGERQSISDSRLPFGGRLRRHAAPAGAHPHHHSAVEHHSHAAGTPGVVTVDGGNAGNDIGKVSASDGDSSATLARLLSLAQQALDLPGALPTALATVHARSGETWRQALQIDFDSRSTSPLLRPPQGR
ncbi:MAG: hypothetical protein ABIN96_13060 [Rubrivivax sp.]